MKPHPFDLLVGHWNTTGQSMVQPGQSPMIIRGTDKYEWLPARQFLLHHADVWMGDEKVIVFEAIGPCGETTTGIPMHSFTNDGTHQTMHASLDAGGVWTFAGDGLRAFLTIVPDQRVMTARWERTTDDGSWEHWLDMQFTKTT